jgi:hypothetical protein
VPEDAVDELPENNTRAAGKPSLEGNMEPKGVIRLHRLHSNAELTKSINTRNERRCGFQWVIELPQRSIFLFILNFDAGRPYRRFAGDEKRYVEGKAVREVTGARVDFDGVELCE